MLKQGSINVIVGWVAIDELVEKQSIEWDSPIRWTWEESMVVPDSVIIRYIDSSLVLIEIIVAVFFVETQCS